MKIQQLINNYIKKDQILTIKLHNNNNELINTIQYQITNQTVNELITYLKNLLNQPQIIGFQTLDNNIHIDYYLTTSLKLIQFNNTQTISLKPFYTQQQQNQITLDSFIFIQCIGIGGFSRVYLVRCKINGQFMALKMITKQFIEQNDKFQIIQNERNIMVYLNNNENPFLCKLLCVFETKQYICFAMEYCPGGELFQQLKKVKKMDENQAKFYFSEICIAINHLHENQILYRDIKPENILLDQYGHIKLADFGLAKPNHINNELSYSFCGSPEYMAPEMLLKLGHNFQIDHYCLGALLYELLTGLPPFYSSNSEQLYQNILQNELTIPTKNISLEAKDLIFKLLSKDPNTRLGKNYGIYEILKHPWLQDISLYKLMSRNYDPPFKPDLFLNNFDQKEFINGEQQFQKELLKSNSQTNFIPFFNNFYYSAIPLKISQKSASITQINVTNIEEKFTNIILSTTKSKHVSQPQSQIKKKKTQASNHLENKENIHKNTTTNMVKHKKNNQSMPETIFNKQDKENRSQSTQKVDQQQKISIAYNTVKPTENDEETKPAKLLKSHTNQCTLIRYFKQ